MAKVLDIKEHIKHLDIINPNAILSDILSKQHEYYILPIDIEQYIIINNINLYRDTVCLRRLLDTMSDDTDVQNRIDLIRILFKHGALNYNTGDYILEPMTYVDYRILDYFFDELRVLDNIRERENHIIEKYYFNVKLTGQQTVLELLQYLCSKCQLDFNYKKDYRLFTTYHADIMTKDAIRFMVAKGFNLSNRDNKAHYTTRTVYDMLYNVNYCNRRMEYKEIVDWIDSYEKPLLVKSAIKQK